MIAEDKPLTRCTCNALRMLSRHVSQVYDQALAPAGLRSGQYALLRAVSRIGPVGVQALGEFMMLDRSTTGRNLRPLEREGLVCITSDPQDRRTRLHQITKCGQQRLLDAEALWATAQERLETTFGAEPTRALHATFASLLSLNLSARLQ